MLLEQGRDNLVGLDAVAMRTGHLNFLSEVMIMGKGGGACHPVKKKMNHTQSLYNFQAIMRVPFLLHIP